MYIGISPDVESVESLSANRGYDMEFREVAPHRVITQDKATPTELLVSLHVLRAASCYMAAALWIWLFVELQGRRFGALLNSSQAHSERSLAQNATCCHVSDSLTNASFEHNVRSCCF